MLVFKVKLKTDGSIDKYKVRMCVQGFFQKYGVDYQSTFSPASNPTTLRLVCILAAQKNLQLWHCDVVTAFLNADLPKDIDMYIKFPSGLTIDGCEYAKLIKSLYGLKQAPREWHKLAHTILLENFPGLQVSHKDPSFYFMSTPNVTMYLAVHVDDFFLACDPPTWYHDVFLPTLRKHINVLDLGLATHVLGITITQSDHCVMLSQENVILDMQERYGLTDCKPVYLPMDPKFDPPSSPTCDPILPFRNLLGELLWIARCTRPDILFAVNKLSRYNNGYQDVHWQALLRVAKYLCTTSSKALQFSPMVEENFQLTCYVDADWKGCDETMRSTSGYILYFCGAPLSFYSRRQKSVTISSTEAEIYALSEAVTEVLSITQMVSEFAHVQLPIIIHEDNKGAITLSENQVYNSRSKHIKMHKFRVRELVESGDVRISYIPSSQNVADLFTKALPLPAFQLFSSAVLKGVSRDSTR
jgi:hypothetical protein